MHRFLALLCITGTATAQPATGPVQEPASWFSAGPSVGVGLGAERANLLAAGAHFHQPLGRGSLRVQLGATVATELLGRDELTEVHVAVGATASEGPLLVAAAIGPSLARVNRSLYDDRSFEGGARTVLGAAVDVQATLVLVPNLGIGVDAFAHVNGPLPVVSIGPRLVIGRLPGALGSVPPRRRPAR